MFYHLQGETLYRNPIGAVCEETEVDLKLLASDEESVNEINLICIYNDSEEIKKQMIGDGSNSKIFFAKTSINTKKGLYFYFFEVKKSDRILYIYKNITLPYRDDNNEKWQITSTAKNFSTPDFVKGKIMYHIFVDRFNQNGDVKVRDGFYMHKNKLDTPFYLPDENGKMKNEDVYGGNLAGIIDKLGYLSSLGVGIIYLSPIFEASSNHKYNTSDYLKIDDMFGSEEIFKELIKKAGEHGIKIVIDGVFNHTGDDSIYFNRYGRYDSIGAYQSEKSKYYDWYTFNHFNDDYECWWGVKSLPSIKKDQPVFRAFICGVGGVIEKWLKMGVAGLRLDVADELSDRMLRAINRVTKEISSDNIVIGEVWEDASNKLAYGSRRQYLLGSQLDSVMNYPLKEGIISYLRSGKTAHISSVVDMIINNYPKQVTDCLMNILGTHDTMRIITALGTEKYTDDKDKMATEILSESDYVRAKKLLFMAVLMQMTLPGFPCIYYGDETGMQGYGDPFCRRYMNWDNMDKEINNFYKKIAKIRLCESVFTDGTYIEIPLWDGVYFYKRKKEDREVYICINRSNKPYRLSENDYISLLSNVNINEIGINSYDIFAKK